MPAEAAVLSAPTGAVPDAAPPNAGGAHDDAFASLDRLAGDDSAPAKPAPDAGKVDKPNADKPQTDKQEPAKAPDKKPDLETKPSKDDKPKDGELNWKSSPKAFQDAHKVAKAELREALDKIKTLETASPKEFKVADAPEFKSLKEKLDAAQKRADELEETVKYTNYEQSKEYKEKYQQPYEQTATSATATAQQLQVTNEDGTKRAMTAAEFWDIVRADNDDAALAAAEKLFGENSTRAARVVDLRDKVVSAHDAASRAKEDFKKNIGERTKQMQEQQEGFTKAQSESFTKHRDEAITKYPQWFKADEGDTKGAELLEKGMAWADKAFSELPPEQAPKIHAAMRNKAGAFDHVVHKLNTTAARLKEAEAKLAAFEKSKPGQGELPGAGGESDDPMGDMLSKLDKVAQDRD